eukprot:1085131-Prorocentrum_minimum.AAC.1
MRSSVWAIWVCVSKLGELRATAQQHLALVGRGRAGRPSCPAGPSSTACSGHVPCRPPLPGSPSSLPPVRRGRACLAAWPGWVPPPPPGSQDGGASQCCGLPSQCDVIITSLAPWALRV